MADVVTGIRLEAGGEQEFSRSLESAAGSLEKYEDAAKNAQSATGGLADALNQTQLDQQTQAQWDDFAASSAQLSAGIAQQAQGAARLVGAFFDATEEAASYGDEIDKMSQKLGISRRAYQEWTYILGRSGVKVTAARSAMQTLVKVQEGLSKTAEEDLAALGLSLDEAQAMSREELFEAVILGLQGMEEGSERAALAQRLLGRSAATELAPVLNTSAEETRRLRDRFYELGGYMNDEAVDAAVAYGDTMGDLNLKWDAFRRGILTKAMPSITRLREALLDDNNLDGIANLVERIADGGVSLLEYLADHGDQAVDTITAIGGAWATWKGVEIIGTLVTNVQTLYGWLAALGGLLGVGAGTVAGGLALGGLGIAATTERAFDALGGEIGTIGKGHELDEYVSNVAALREQLDALGQIRNDPNQNMYWDFMQEDQYNMLFISLHNAEEELAAAQEAAAQAPQEVAQAADEAVTAVEESVSAVQETVTASAGEIRDDWAEGVDGIAEAATEEMVAASDAMAHNAEVLAANAEVWGEQVMIAMANGIRLGAQSWMLPALDEVITLASSRAVVAAGGVSSSTINYGGVNLAVYGSSGQSAEEIGDAVMDRLGYDEAGLRAVYDR